jgi:hypothetical protein
MPNWLQKEVNRANRNLLLVNGFLILIVLLVLGSEHRYILNFVLGCEKITDSEQLSLSSPERRVRNFVTVQGTKSATTGYQLRRHRGSFFSHNFLFS